ncbi:class I SAM-dependent methyltransferase [Helicobacter jaachi]|nr:class I SAM-dependent methyltransferase [Helicobacter jaachi]
MNTQNPHTTPMCAGGGVTSHSNSHATLADSKNPASNDCCGASDNSQATYAQKYAGGYGIRYPEGHVIRFYERILRYELKKLSGKMLDFGCGNGTHAQYFTDKGYEVYGVDIIESALTQASKAIGQRAKLITPNQSLQGLFVDSHNKPLCFDIIFANQSLYYLDSEHLRNCVQELYDMSSPGAICFFTMMSRKNGYAKHIARELENGLSEVVLSGRLQERSYIHFIDDVAGLQAAFAPFKPLYIGEYNIFELYEPYSSEGSSHHFIFIGKKE